MINRTFNRVGVLMGGPSAEREVSLVSGAAVAEGLEQAGYQVVRIDVQERNLAIPDDVEAVFIALHGEFGEDGAVQRLLTEKGIPYTGAGPEASEASFDKQKSKEILSKAGLPIPSYEIIRQAEERTFSLPLVIKPLRQGSSFGVHRIFEEDIWEEAFADTLSYDGVVLVETFIEGRELTVGIVDQDVLPVVEICAPEGDYNYKAKYTKGTTSYIVPADITPEKASYCQAVALKAYQVLNGRGLSRIDFRMNTQGEAFILENNTIPGFTPTSLLPKAAKAVGIEFSELCDRIMRLACI